MPPVNNNFANRILLTGNTFSVTGDNTGATLESGETYYAARVFDCDNSVWYEVVAPATGTLTLDTCDSVGLADSVIWAFIGTAVNALGLIDFDDDTCGTLSRLTINVTSGQSYKISVTGYSPSDVGAFTLKGVFTSDPPPDTPPANDNFTQAQTITFSDFPIVANNSTATKEVGEPTSQYNSLWYEFTPEDDMLLNVAFSSSSYAVNMYTGVALNELNPVTPIISSSTRKLFQLFNYLTYKMAAYSTNVGAHATFTLTGTATYVQSAANNYFSEAIELEGSTFSVTANNSMANVQPFEATTNYYSLWYTYTPTKTEYFKLTKTSGIGVKFNIYLGTQIQNLVLVGTGNNSLSVTLQANIKYYIAVCSQNVSTFGAYTFNGNNLSDIPLVATTLGTDIGGVNSNKGLVYQGDRDRVFILGARSLTNVVYYSDNSGVSLTDSGLNFNDIGWTSPGTGIMDPFNRSLFMDNDDNVLICARFFISPGNPLKVIICKRDKVTGIWTKYYSDAINIFFGYGGSMDICQGDDGTLHIIMTMFEYTYDIANILYISFLDGVFSTPKVITSYSYLNSTAVFQAWLRIVNYNSQILVFWRRLGPPNAILYSVLADQMDIVFSATQWVTSHSYTLYSSVFQSGNYYTCLVSHVSGVFATDLANGKWQIVTSYSTPTTWDVDTRTYISNVRSNGKLYAVTSPSGDSSFMSDWVLYEDFVDITPTLEGDYQCFYVGAAMDGDIILQGSVQNYNQGGFVKARIGGTWMPAHDLNSESGTQYKLDPNNTSTYNFQHLR